MSPARAVLVVLVAAAHLGAATFPCPAPAPGEAPRATDAPAAHAVDDHSRGGAHGAGHAAPQTEGSASRAGAEMAARCTCGCGGAASGDGVAGRLGPALLRAAPRPDLPRCGRAVAPAALRLPDAPPRALDPVPI